MRMKEFKVMQMGGIALFLFAIILLFWIIPTQVRDVDTFGVSPQFFPKVLGYILLVLSVWLFIDGCLKKTVPDQKIYKINVKEIKLVLITLIIMVVYILTIELLGYLIATIMVLGILMWIYGQRNLRIVILISILLPIIISQFFTRFLHLRLP